MTKAAIDALRAEQARARELFASLDAEEWGAASDCAGWRVQDVVCHMASTFQTIAAPGTLDGGASHDVEVNAEVPVQARRDWTPAQVVAAYEEWSEKGIAALAALQEPPLAETVVPLGNLGSHPMHVLANAIVFDHYCHLRHDIGPAVPRAAALPHDADALAATLEWMLTGVPQMCAEALAPVLDRPVQLVFDGEGGGRYVLRPPAEPGGFAEVVAGDDPDAAATVRSSAHDFVQWGTKRRDWRDAVTVTGDADLASRVLDAINVI